ncbi:MAG: DNA-processing protein DprA [Cyanobacteriota bacterium]
MEELKYWLAFNSIEGLGAVSIMKIWNHFGSMKEAWSASSADLYEIETIYSSIIEKIVTSRPDINPDKLEEDTGNYKTSVLCIIDPLYPDLLKQIYDPPVVLYYKGDFNLCDLSKTVAIVGTRTPTDYGREMSYKISSELANFGVTIVSGLAEGIDTAAHTACIEINGKTIAVLGSGLNHIYPKINNNLANKIIDSNGVVLSEYPPDSKPDGWRFPYRNRIISGLSYATILVEAKARGGGLITAKNALEQNREVFGVSSRVNSNSNDGVHNLIYRGEAKIYTTISKLLETLNWVIVDNESPKKEQDDKIPINETVKNTVAIAETIEIKKEPEKAVELPSNSPEEIIMNLLDYDAVAFDVLLNKSGLDTSTLLSTMTILELRGLVCQVGGKRYRRKI